MYNWLFISVMVICGLVGSFIDLKERWIPDYINFFMIFMGIGGHALVSIIEKNIWPLALSVGVAGIFYLLSYILVYIGQWGGGDAKMLIGFGALLPVFPTELSMLNPLFGPWPFFISMWLNIMFLGAFYGLFFMMYLIIKHRKKFGKQFKINLEKQSKFSYVFALSILAVLFVSLINLSLFYLLLFLWVMANFGFYTYIAGKSIEKTSMFKIIPPIKLIEGDWIIKDVKIGKKVVYKSDRSGIDRKNINKLISLYKKGKLPRVKIKDGVPFIPSFLIGLAVTLIWGDFLLLFIRLFLG